MRDLFRNFLTSIQASRRRLTSQYRGLVTGHVQREFDANGFVLKRQLLPRESMALWKDAVLRDKEARDGHRVDPSTGRLIEVDATGVSVWMTDELPAFFDERLCSSPLASAMSEVMGGSDSIELLSCKPVVKFGKTLHPTPWHQDWAYWQGKSHKVSCWIALDDAMVHNGCLRVVPGSHRLGLLEHAEHTEASHKNNSF